MTRTRPSGQLLRIVALVAVVLGMLAMHGLASTHSASAATPLAGSLSGHTTIPDAPAHVHRRSSTPQAEPDVAHDDDTPHAQAAGTSPAPEGAACDLDCPTTMLCLAVLTAAIAAAALHLAQHRRSHATTRIDPRPVRPPAARAALPPPDPVAELCTSRT